MNEAQEAAFAFARATTLDSDEYVDAAIGMRKHMIGTEYVSQAALRILADYVETLEKNYL